jgi:hypothetical protein
MTDPETTELLLGTLREAAADRPTHQALLEELVRWHEAGEPEPEPELSRPGVSFEVAVALAGDVDRAYREIRNVAGPQYPELRVKHRAAAAKRRRTQSPSGTGLENLFRL